VVELRAGAKYGRRMLASRLRWPSGYFLQATPGVIELNPRRLALAVIGVGSAVAAANRPEDPRAKSRNLFAPAAAIGKVTLSGRVFAPQSGSAIALDTYKSAAKFAGPRRDSAGRSERQAETKDECCQATMNQVSFHETLPLVDDTRAFFLIA
jgi:hypothetical protein